MSAFGLWGLPGPDPGTLARETLEGLDRPSSAWAPHLSLRGIPGPDLGTAARSAFQQETGSWSERVGFLESWSVLGSYDAGSAVILLAALEAWDVSASQPMGFSEICGSLETWSAIPGGLGSFEEITSVLESWSGIDSTLGQGFGSIEEIVGAAETWTGAPGGLGAINERVDFRESWTGVAGPPSPTPVPSDLPQGRKFIRTGKRRRFGDSRR